jgi:hypothetical protein
MLQANDKSLVDLSSHLEEFETIKQVVKMDLQRFDSQV